MTWTSRASQNRRPNKHKEPLRNSQKDTGERCSRRYFLPTPSTSRFLLSRRALSSSLVLTAASCVSPFSLSLHPHPILNWFSRDRREQASARIGSPVIDRFATAAAFRSFVRREIPPLRRRFSRWESWLRNYASVSTWHAVSSADSFHSSVFSSEIPLHEIVGRSGRRVTSRHVAVISPQSCRRGCTLQLNHAINFPMFTHFPVRNTR